MSWSDVFSTFEQHSFATFENIDVLYTGFDKVMYFIHPAALFKLVPVSFVTTRHPSSSLKSGFNLRDKNSFFLLGVIFPSTGTRVQLRLKILQFRNITTLDFLWFNDNATHFECWMSFSVLSASLLSLPLHHDMMTHSASLALCAGISHKRVSSGELILLAFNLGKLLVLHDDVIKWKHFPRYWPFVRGNHRSRWIPRTMASDADLWCFPWATPE